MVIIIYIFGHCGNFFETCAHKSVCLMYFACSGIPSQEKSLKLNSWIFESRPNCFWLTGFFNPQGFLTAMRQEVTRAHASKGWALDAVKLTNDITKMMKEDVTAPPNPDVGGVYIYGLFLDGAGWDKKNTKLIWL